MAGPESKWLRKLYNHQCNSHDRLTNIRFADDIFILAKSRTEFVSMMEFLLLELAEIDLEVNHTKTKILTTDPNNFKKNTSSVLIMYDRYFQVLAPHE